MGTFDITDELDWTGWKKPHHGTYSEGVSNIINYYNKLCIKKEYIKK